MNRIILLFSIFLIFSSCSSSVTWKRPLKEKRAAKSEYQKCLEDNPGNTAKCKELKKSYDEKSRSIQGQSQDPVWGGHRYDR